MFEKEKGEAPAMWVVFAILSAVFAALTSILAKVGIGGVNSHLATAIRTVVVVVMPGVSVDLKFDVELVGEGAEANLYGAYICAGQEKVKIAVDMHHKVPHCNSRQLFKGIAGGNSKVDFYGKIIVAKDAQRTEAYQENHNLLLSDGAKVDTKPQLEIYADDVRCSHGSTVGYSDAEAIFYMRQRGISEADARRLQIEGFVQDVV